VVVSPDDIRKTFVHISDSQRGGILSWLGLPMVNRGGTIGALSLFSSKADAFSELDIALASRASYQIAGAIDNAGLFAGLKSAETELANSVIERSEAASQNEVIAEIGRIISSTLNIEEVYESFSDQVRKLIGFDVLYICIVDREGRMGQIAHRVGSNSVENRAGSLVPIEGSITKEVAKLKRAINVQGISEQELQEKFPFSVFSYQADIRSWLCTPLINGGEFVGSFMVLLNMENAFTDRDAELAERVGNQIAGAIDSIRLYGDLKKVEVALTDSNNSNQMILETAHDAFVGIDEKGKVVAWNSQAETTFGWPASEAVGRVLADLIIPNRFVGQHVAGLSNYLVARQGPVVNRLIEMVARHRDGREFPVELTIAPLRLGDRYFFNAFIRDITDRKEPEDALTRSEERFRAVYNNAANGIGTRTLDGTPKDLNPAFLDMVGYTMEEVRALEPGVLYDTKYLRYEKRVFERALQGENIPPYEKEYIHKDGTRIATEVRASLERDDEGNAIGIVAVVTDITQRQSLEKEIARYTESLEIANAEMQQLDQLKDEFISTVSHELRTPLTSIKGSAEILLTFDDEDRETRLEFLRIINKECDRLTRLVTEVLDLSRGIPADELELG
jgi:PAS domain S-box-containing protein